MSAVPVPEEARIGRPRSPWGRRLLIGLAVGYMAVILLAPLVGLVTGAFAQGVGAIFTALSDPQVRRAFGLTLMISVIIDRRACCAGNNRRLGSRPAPVSRSIDHQRLDRLALRHLACRRRIYVDSGIRAARVVRSTTWKPGISRSCSHSGHDHRDADRNTAIYGA